MREQPQSADHPPVDPEAWELAIRGTVAEERTLSLAELRAVGGRTVTEDFDCLEGWTDPDLTWRGIPADELIAEAGPTPASSHVLVRSLEPNYVCAFERSRMESALVALELDGEALPVERGGPARLVLPKDESQCFESVKWLGELCLYESAPDAADTAGSIATARLE